jgi:DNA-binding protein Fis
MNPHRITAYPDESTAVGPEAHANQAGAPPCEAVSPIQSSPAQVTRLRDEPDESDTCLAIEHPARGPGQKSAVAIRGAARAEPLGEEASAKTKEAVAQKQTAAAWPLTLDEIIKQTLIRLLRETGGNRRRTASLLGISRSTLYRMLARYGIDNVGRAATPRKRSVDSSEPSA